MIASQTSGFEAQCPRALLHYPPAFGALVKILPQGTQEAPAADTFTADDPFLDPQPPRTTEGALFAVVYSASTGSGDLGRKPVAYELDEEQLQREQPQIFDLLSTEFAAMHIGWTSGGRVRIGIPPRPPRLHAPILPCTEAEVCALTAAPELLRFLLRSAATAHTDELMVSVLRTAYECRGADYRYLVTMGKQIALLLGEEPERLSAILHRLEP